MVSVLFVRQLNLSFTNTGKPYGLSESIILMRKRRAQIRVHTNSGGYGYFWQYWYIVDLAQPINSASQALFIGCMMLTGKAFVE